ncbi:hypothetical protein Tco_0619143, partial [Tanacetum coccineum]
ESILDDDDTDDEEEELENEEEDMEYVTSLNLNNRRLDVFGASVISRRHRVLCHLGVMINCFWSLDGNTTSGSNTF